MKQYLKMKDLFPFGAVSKAGVFNINSDGDVVVDIDGISFHATTEEASNYVTHAINSHDELVQMNQELLAALESVIEWYDMEADHSIEPDFYKRMAACQVSEDMAREAIAKAKGGAA